MTSSTIITTKTDFDNTNWEQILAACEPKECNIYYRKFFEQSRQAEDANHLAKAKVFLILGYIALLHLEVPPYEPPFSNMDHLQVVDDAEWDVLAEIAPTINDAEMRARIADLLWVEKKGKFPMAKLAIESYLKSANILEDPIEWVSCFERINRATQLWNELGGKKNNQIVNVISFIEEKLDNLNGEDPGIFSAKLMEILIPLQPKDTARYIALAEKAATNNPANKCACETPKRSRAYWEIKARWHHSVGQPDEEKKAQIYVAETYVDEAQGHLVCKPGSYSQASWLLQFSIEAFRKIGGMQQRTDEIYKLYRKYQCLSWEEHDIVQSETIDLGQIVQTAEKLVSGQTFRQAILSLATITDSQSVISLRNLIREKVRNNPLQFYSPMFKYSQDARVVGVRDSLFLGSDEEKESVLEADMFLHATFFQDAFAKAFVRPAIQRIILEHPIHFREFKQIVQNNPFIPPGREYIFARGLYAGMMGDFLIATHLLIPQLEQAFRHLLDKNKVRITGLDSDGVQDAHLLDTLLKHPKLTKILGKDVVFDMRGLLNERFGSNLRNEMAHGLIETFSFFSDRCVYLWWLTLHLCCVPLVNYPNPHPQGDEEAEL